VAEVTVFVDDAVRGRLPDTCAKEGIPTTDRLTMRCEVGGGSSLGVAWLLILAGPLGWLGLFIIGLSRRPADLMTVRLPVSESAYRRGLVAQRRLRVDRGRLRRPTSGRPGLRVRVKRLYRGLSAPGLRPVRRDLSHP
jgi:hypothetical protein